MNSVYRAQFWAEHRGRQSVWFWTPGNASAEEIARSVVRQARLQFNARWPLGQDPIHLVGIEDTATGQTWGEGKP